MKSRVVFVLLFAVLVGLIWSKRFGAKTEDRAPASVTDAKNETAKSESAQNEAAREDAALENEAAAIAAEEAPPAPAAVAPEIDPRGFVAETEPGARLPLKEKIPLAQTIREEVAKNPHGTPMALTRFSLAIGEKMDAAQKSEPEAKALFQELEDCTLGSDQKGRNSVQALCLLNAKRLGQAFPSLAREYETLERRSDPRTVDIIQGMSL